MNTDKTVSLHQRQQDVDTALEAADQAASAFLDAKATGQRHLVKQHDEALDEALRQLRAADSRLAKTRRRLDKTEQQQGQTAS